MKHQFENHQTVSSAADETSASSAHQPEPSLNLQSIVRDVKQGAKLFMETQSQTPTLDIRGAADFIGVTVAALRKWKLQGRGPAYFRAGRLVRYRRAALENWIAKNTVPPRETSDQPRSAG